MKKISDQSGETLVETLLSIMIILLAILFLSGSVIWAQRINASVKNKDISFHYGTSDAEAGAAEVKIGVQSVLIDVQYYTDNDYIYYSEN